MDRQAQPVLAGPPEDASIVGHPERRRLGPGDVDADDAPVAPADRLLHDDLVQLVREGAVEAEDQARLDRVLERRPVHPAQRGRDDVIEVLLAAAVPLHRVEAELHGRDVVLAVGAADDLVDGPLDRDRRALDQLGPVEELEVAVEAPVALLGHRDRVAELPVVAGRELDPLGVGDAPHDRRRHRPAEMAMQLRERDLAGELSDHRWQDTRSATARALDQPDEGVTHRQTVDPGVFGLSPTRSR